MFFIYLHISSDLYCIIFIFHISVCSSLCTVVALELGDGGEEFQEQWELGP